VTSHPWPDGTDSVAIFSVNFDAEALDLTVTTEDRLYGRYTYGRYGVRAGLPRMLDLLAKHAIRATFFVCAADAQRHREPLRRIMSEGHEIAGRGMALEDLTSLGESEYQTLRVATEILTDICGTPPVGFRAPGNSLSVNTLSHLAELDYEYDSSFQDDDYPYVISVAGGRRLVEIPTSFALEDAAVYSARHTHARLIAIWEDEVAAMYDAGTLVPLTVHLRGDVGSTRAARIDALDALLARMTSRTNLTFMTGAELARHTASLDLAAEPDPIERHVATLREVPYRGDLAVTNSAYKMGSSR